MSEDNKTTKFSEEELKALKELHTYIWLNKWRLYMSENTKLEKEDIQSIKDIQTKYLQIQQGIGQIRVSLIKLNQQQDVLVNAENDLNQQFLDNQNAEKELVEKLNKTYGDGTLDIENEVFIPNSKN